MQPNIKIQQFVFSLIFTETELYEVLYSQYANLVQCF
jgi:hypothetical protein